MWVGRCCRNMDGVADEVTNSVVEDKVIAYSALGNNVFLIVPAWGL